MKKFSTKKLLSVLFVVAFLAAALMMATGVSAANVTGTTAKGLKYSISDYSGEVTIVGYKGNPQNVVIPSKIAGKPVTSVSGAFVNCESLVTVTIPKGVKAIYDGAFSGCINLMKVELPEGLTTISQWAFSGCTNLKSIAIPGTVEFIGSEAFAKCKKLTSITFGEGVETIQQNAFEGCTSLQSITLPQSLKNIYPEAFLNCTKLKNISIPDGIECIGLDAFYKTARYNTASNWKNGVLYIGNVLIEVKPDVTYECTVKDGTVAMADGAFIACAGITKVNLPGTLKYISNDAFYLCMGLKKVNMPDGIERIGEYAFFGCTALNNVVIPKTVKEIGTMAFACCSSLTSIKVREGNKNYHVDGNCLIQTKEKVLVRGTKNSTIPTDKSVTTIGVGAFSLCTGMKKNITIPASVTTICEVAFYGCDYSSLTVPKSLKKVETDAFDARNPLVNIYYQGTQAERYKINVIGENDGFDDANWTYNICKNGKHAYSSTCDRFCNYCNHKRYVSVKHTYTNKCDKTCNKCFGQRSITHTYKTATTKATLKKNGSVVKKCTVCGYVQSNTPIYYPKTVKLVNATLAYNGKQRTPAVTVKNSAGKVLKKGTDYTVTYAAGRKNVGTYKVTVKMIGKYSGTKTLSFKILPKATYIKSLAQGVKSIAVAWAPKSEQVTGYQLQYSTAKDFANAKTVTVSDKKKTSHTVKNLASNKTYYVRIRTYKVVNNVKVFSGWSAVKSVKTK